MVGDEDNPYEPPSQESQQADADLPRQPDRRSDTRQRLMRLAIGSGGLMLIPGSVIAFTVTCSAATLASNRLVVGVAAGVAAALILCTAYFSTRRN